MTAALVIVALASLVEAVAIIALAFLERSTSNALAAMEMRYLETKSAADLATGNLAAAKDVNDADEKLLGGLRAANADLADRLKVAEARAVAGLSVDELRDVVNGVPPHGDGARAIPGAGQADAGAAVPHGAGPAASEAGRPGRGVR